MAGEVRVKLFASLRDAAGTDRTTAGAGSVADVVAELSARWGEPFASRMARSQVAVGERFLSPDSDEAVPAGSEVVLLPPFSGG